jgi:hypothetical protein
VATVVILEHPVQRNLGFPYMIHTLAERWRASGHSVLVHHGADGAPPGDIAVLNVDLTVVPPEYLPLLERYPCVINGGVLDISKRSFSQDLLRPGSDWAGPVIVKTDANVGGRGERLFNEVAKRDGLAKKIPTGPVLEEYPVYATLHEVPPSVWATRGLVVEKFLPEQDERGYYSRHWIFLGDRERCARYRAAVPVIKSRDMLDRESVPVPEEMRRWREKLGFDFGKFDFVRHGERWVLLDVNRTPVLPMQAGPDYGAAMDQLAEGLNAFLPRR